MPSKPLSNNVPNEKMARVIRQLRGEKAGTDPVRAAWSIDDKDAPQTFGYWNFKLGRAEYGVGKIPAEYLDDYMPQKEG